MGLLVMPVAHSAPDPQPQRVAKPMVSLERRLAYSPSQCEARGPLPFSRGSVAYKLSLSPGWKMGFGDCVGWSVAGEGTGPFAFAEGGTGRVAWARSADGLHDAVELFVKKGIDPLSEMQRPDPHIGWTGMLQRTYSLRLLYEVVEGQTRASPGTRCS